MGSQDEFDPPGVMWPEPGSGFEPSAYSPAGGEAQEARLLANARWRREHGYRSLWARPAVRIAAFVVGFVVAVLLIAVVSSLL